MLGGGNPLQGFLDREGAEWQVAQATLDRAIKLDQERRKGLAEGIGNAVTNALAKLFK